MSVRIRLPRYWLVVVALLATLNATCSGEPHAADNQPLRVAAASSLMDAFEELGQRFEQTTGAPVAFSFGATGMLASQIRAGAPFDVLAAADVKHVDELIAAGQCDGPTKSIYARGRLVVWTRGQDAPQDLRALTDERFVRIAIANPEHAPYGTAAKEALVATRVWQDVHPKIVYAETVRQAMQFAQTGNVEAAFVPLSLVTRRKDGAWRLVDERLHRPLDHAMVVCRGGGEIERARAFVAFLATSASAEILRRHGLALPGEAVSAP